MASPSNKPQGRSRVTNAASEGRVILTGIDGRGGYARRLRDVMQAHLSDLGGADRVSEAERSIVRRVATLTVELECMEIAFASNLGDTDVQALDAYQRVASSLRRLLEAIGLQRRSRDITPTLSSYIAEITAQKADRAKAEDVEEVDA